MKTKKFTGDRIFDFVNVTVILLITIIILVPLLNGRGIGREAAYRYCSGLCKILEYQFPGSNTGS